MPTGVLSLGTIAQRLRAAADSSTLTPTDIENLAACAETLERGFPSTKQLRAIASLAENLAPVINDPAFWRVVSSLDYWVTNGRPPKKPAPVSKALAANIAALDQGKPDWMVHNEQDAIETASIAKWEAANTAVGAITGAIRVLLDEIDGGDYVDDTWLDLEALIRTLKRLA